MLIKQDNPILTAKALPVDLSTFSTEDSVWCKLLNEFEKRITALGLSAPQLGVSTQMMIIRPKCKETLYIINPEVVWSLGSKKSLEGCECIPKKRFILKRPRLIKIRYYDPYEECSKTKILTWKYARVFSHEYDHLNGELITKGKEVNTRCVPWLCSRS